MCLHIWVHRTFCDTRDPASLSDHLVLQNPFAAPGPCYHTKNYGMFGAGPALPFLHGALASPPGANGFVETPTVGGASTPPLYTGVLFGGAPQGGFAATPNSGGPFAGSPQGGFASSPPSGLFASFPPSNLFSDEPRTSRNNAAPGFASSPPASLFAGSPNSGSGFATPPPRDLAGSPYSGASLFASSSHSGNNNTAEQLGATKCPIHTICCRLTRTFVCFNTTAQADGGGGAHCGHFAEFHRIMDPERATHDPRSDDLRRLRAGEKAGFLKIFPDAFVRPFLTNNGQPTTTTTTAAADPRPKLFSLAVRSHRIIADMEALFDEHMLRGQYRHDLKTLYMTLMLSGGDHLRYWEVLAARNAIEPVIALDWDAETDPKVAPPNSPPGRRFHFGPPCRDPIETIEQLYQRPRRRDVYKRNFFSLLEQSYDEWPAEDPATFLPVERVNALRLPADERQRAMRRDAGSPTEDVETFLRYNAARGEGPSPHAFFTGWEDVEWDEGSSTHDNDHDHDTTDLDNVPPKPEGGQSVLGRVFCWVWSGFGLRG